MFKELIELQTNLERKSAITEDLSESYKQWLTHPVTIAMMSDLKLSYIQSMDIEEAKPQRDLLEQIIYKWGESRNDN